MTDHKHAVINAKDLDQLLTALHAAERADRLATDHEQQSSPDRSIPTGIEQRYGIDLSRLPHWGPAPKDCTTVYSWDSERVLCADGTAWSVAPRQPFDAQPRAEDIFDGKPHTATPTFYASSGSYRVALRATTLDNAIDEVRLGKHDIHRVREMAADMEDSLEDPQTFDIYRTNDDELLAQMIDVTY